MKKNLYVIFGLPVVLAPIFCSAETKYLNARIERIEACKSDGNVYVYVKDISGTTPLSSNGCSNDLNIPSVKLNTTAGSLTELEKLMSSIALAALASDRFVRVRFDDETKNMASIALD